MTDTNKLHKHLIMLKKIRRNNDMAIDQARHQIVPSGPLFNIEKYVDEMITDLGDIDDGEKVST